MASVANRRRASCWARPWRCNPPRCRCGATSAGGRRCSRPCPTGTPAGAIAATTCWSAWGRACGWAWIWNASAHAHVCWKSRSDFSMPTKSHCWPACSRTRNRRCFSPVVRQGSAAQGVRAWPVVWPASACLRSGTRRRVAVAVVRPRARPCRAMAVARMVGCTGLPRRAGVLPVAGRIGTEIALLRGCRAGARCVLYRGAARA